MIKHSVQRQYHRWRVPSWHYSCWIEIFCSIAFHSRDCQLINVTPVGCIARKREKLSKIQTYQTMNILMVLFVTLTLFGGAGAVLGQVLWSAPRWNADLVLGTDVGQDAELLWMNKNIYLDSAKERTVRELQSNNWELCKQTNQGTIMKHHHLISPVAYLGFQKRGPNFRWPLLLTQGGGPSQVFQFF